MFLAVALTILQAPPPSFEIKVHDGVTVFSDINGSGAAVGPYDEFWTGTEMKPFPKPICDGQAINDLGFITAYRSEVSALYLPVRFKDNVAEHLTLLEGAKEGHPRNINYSGTVVGDCGRTWRGRPVFWIGQAVEEIPLLPGDIYGRANGINTAGTIVGNSVSEKGSRPFIFKDGKTEELPLPPGSKGGGANAINDSGVVAGKCWLEDKLVACFWVDGALKQIGILPGFASSEALDINNSGDIVGICEHPFRFLGDGASDPNFYKSRAFLFRNDVLHDVNALIPELPKDVLVYRISAINNSGVLAGGASKDGRPFHGVILTPRPK